MSRQLSQQEIDAVFRKQDRKREAAAAHFDFRRPDRIPKSQVRAIHLLHDVFARNLVSSLSAYLRSYLTVNLVSVEQLSYAEFLEGLPSPTCLVSMGLHPYDGNGVLELNPSLAFPIIEMLLGGTGKQSGSIQRDITEIEQKLLDGLLRIIMNDLREAWKGVTEIDFSIESMETEPQLLYVLAPNEAVVAIGVEIRIAEAVGMMNIALPSIVIKMMRQKFDQQWSVRKTLASEGEQARFLDMLRDASLTLEARLDGMELSVQNLLDLTEGHLVVFDRSIHTPLDLVVNGREQYSGQIVATAAKRAFVIERAPEAKVKEAPRASLPAPPSLPALPPESAPDQ
ncbi:MAG: flagellar motor switch protein FliM [Acidobacteriia bacterium]|nr:flagellar motor switch protein FliM [Terriglobia bacterium]MBV8904406.1 flagellar motor switch protein FliM [Terriglobia bacterium]